MKLGSRQKQQQLYLTRFGIVLLLVLCVLMLSSVYKRYQIAAEMNQRRDGLAEEKANLQNRKQVLEEKVEYLEDDRSVEAEIRRNFDVAKEGEQVVIILDAPEETAVTPIVTPETQVTPWYIFWR